MNTRQGLAPIVTALIAALILGGGFFAYQTYQNSSNAKQDSDTLTKKTELLSYSDNDYSWIVKYPSTYKLATTTNNPSPFYRLDIDSGEKKLCSIYLSMPTYKKSAVEEKGIENIYISTLKTETVQGEKTSSIENITLGKMTGTLFDLQTGNLTISQFIAKYPAKKLVGSFGLSCNNIDKESFAIYRKEFMKIVESFE